MEQIPMTTLCDGVPRAIRPRTSTVFVTYITTLNGYQSYFPVTSKAIRTDIEPDCSVDDDASDCTRLWSSWNYVSSSLLHRFDFDAVRSYERRKPPCVEPMQTCQANGCGVNPGDRQTLYYWPITTSGDICQQNGSTLTPTPTDDSGAPNTVEYGDLTFTSPSVYVVYETASADWSEVWRFKGPRQRSNTWIHPCGPTATALTLTLDPTDLSTIEKDDFKHSDERRSVNWADFNYLAVPLSAYNFQCSERIVGKYWSSCPRSHTIYDNYSPYFQLPQEIISEVPEW
ncbi:hypothetical protein G7Y89_g14755 [Cudoniella acicularis]|uniref:Uncharacterized protein n=1 Tax=Cudoniella acicularis TaxID=354080 RepID=A0A8H4VR76_9HELO|nr:hypothetical protein G7Y89_g14755 [Cudoniella acicularis]